MGMGRTGLFGWMQERWRWMALALCGLAGLLVGFTGFGSAFERFADEARWRARQHPASGQLHIVEIDARSIAAIAHWPWPRSNYAVLIDRLREAGAASVTFDVDFSSHSVPEQDAAFAGALERAGGRVILPTFGQESGGGEAGWTDSLPIPELRDHAMLAAVSILPDPDGTIRRAPLGTMTAGTPRPSLSAMIAGANGAADQDFPIDYAIDPNTIPRHSFIDIRDGRFDPKAIAGKDIVIGATAIEMGDRYAAPNYGVIPGVVIQAMAAETLRRGVPVEAGWQLPLLLGLLLSWIILAARSRLLLGAAAAWSPVLVFGATTLADSLWNTHFPVVPALAPIGAAFLSATAMRMLRAARRRSLHDARSGLPNRLALREALRSGQGMGIVAARFADFDRLAASLDAEGTSEMVRRVRDRIATVTEGSLVHRIENRVLAWCSLDETQIEAQLATIRTLMLSPIEVGGRRVDVTLAFGVAAGERREHAEKTIARAALAADHALAEGRSWHYHDATDDDALERELSLLGELDEAVGKGEIQVYYQPKLDLGTDRIGGVEALVRWNHPTRGFLCPDLFIPLAERSDRIASLTLHVVGQTIADLLVWRAAGHEIAGAVNLSAKLLSASDFIAALRDLIDASGIAPQLLTFEVTESAAMTDPASAAAALQSFRDLGIAISMDDYGTGQSTLSYIKQLPLSELKIDRSFVQFAHQSRSDGALVRSTIDLAHELGLKVVAEGVEDIECLAFLRAIHCDMVQGYLISRPVPAPDLAALLGQSFAEAA
ncbi:EAL domain-containing protein [Sphingomonas sp. LB-2]|uniref:putative bifunctional diguanylate cyclase/phosphodiesterase n=1 Tax=Sphingomonas caeni TaxID=2984949 RepID=UPI00222F802C|nr:EAL domain-containing protein [Sphingomonas caeni]MCW3848859.1 EAL domain-containing protein [Sphingomonas caeni]